MTLSPFRSDSNDPVCDMEYTRNKKLKIRIHEKD